MSKLTWYYEDWKQWDDAGRPDNDDVIKLTILCLDNNELTQIDVSKLIKLTILSLTNNKLTQIDVSKLTKLKYLYLNNNPISQSLYFHMKIQDIKLIKYINKYYLITDYL